METQTRPARDYELMTVLIPDMADEDTQATLDRVAGYITDVQGEITETLTDSPWGRRRLAYTIRHEGVDYRDGFYTVTHFTALPGQITEIERELKLNTSVIRYLLVMDDPKAGETHVPDGTSGDSQAADATAGETRPNNAATGETEAAVATAVEARPNTSATDEIQANDAAPQSAGVAAEDAAEETPVEAPASGTEAAVIETAETIEGEEEPAPANGTETESDTEEA